MNLLASYDWLKQYVRLTESPEAFASRVSLSGPGVERLHPQGEGFRGIVVGHVVDVKPHPNADKLRLAVADAGSKKLSIVCGGSNLKADQWVAVAQVGAKVRWHGEGEPVELKPAEIRGVKSDGMICAANEIGLFDAFPHAERQILDLGEAIPGLKVKTGAPLAEALGFSGDTVMDIEITSNRPDVMGMVGLAREAAAILKRPFLWKPPAKIKPGREKLGVAVKDEKLCPRYMAVRVDGVQVGPSPWWLKRRLLSAGLRPINNVVDITNFVMLELGQPMHAFDADKLAEGRIVVRKAKNGETLAALDGKTYALTSDMLVIADADAPVAVAGVMGGEGTGVALGTTSIVFEAAAFDPVSVRRTARKLNLYSDSQLRFEKGLSTELPPFALARAVELCHDIAGGTVGSAVSDVKAGAYKPRKFSIGFDEISSLIGIAIKKSDAVDILKRLGFKLQATGRKLQATVPFWRDHDIESGRDLVEEIARVYGYGNLPAVFPTGISQESETPELRSERRIRAIAKGAGLTETMTYSFVSADLLRKAGYDPSMMLKVQNPLSADFEFMRTTILPSLIQVAAENQERDREEALFEIANVYYPGKGLPDEQPELGAAFLGGDEAWKKAKGFVEHLLHELGIRSVEWKRGEKDPFWHPGRSVQAFADGKLLGTLGELHPDIASRFKLDGRLAMVDLPLKNVFDLATGAKTYQPLPQFPEAKRDISLIVDRKTTVDDIQKAMKSACAFLTSAHWFDTYAGKGLPHEKKSVAFHLTFARPERTLESTEVDLAMADIENELKAELGADIRR